MSKNKSTETQSANVKNNTKTKKSAENKAVGKKIISIAIMAGIGVAVAALIGFLFYIPEMNAKSEFSDFCTNLSSAEIERVTVSRQQAFESGSFDDVTAAFEKTLTNSEIEQLSSLLSEFRKVSKYDGRAEGLAGMNDYKITLVYSGKRAYLYVSDDYIYLLNGALRSRFKADNTDVFDYLEELKNSEFE